MYVVFKLNNENACDKETGEQFSILHFVLGRCAMTERIVRVATSFSENFLFSRSMVEFFDQAPIVDVVHRGDNFKNCPDTRVFYLFNFYLPGQVLLSENGSDRCSDVPDVQVNVTFS